MGLRSSGREMVYPTHPDSCVEKSAVLILDDDRVPYTLFYSRLTFLFKILNKKKKNKWN